MTQAELANRAGVTVGMVHQWERWASVPRRDKIGKVDEALDAGGAVYEIWGYMPPGTIKRLAFLEETVAALRLAVEELKGARLDDDPGAGTTRAARATPATRRPKKESR
jgi:transcriptional regulator with XRE-family HTH domain